MHRLIILCLPIGVLLNSGCGEDAFSQIADIELPEHPPAPAVSLELIAGDTAASYLISLSHGLLDDLPGEGAATEIVLYQDGEVLARQVDRIRERRDLFEDSLWYLRLPAPLDSLPRNYRLDATVVGYGTATASQLMPARPVARLIDYEPEGALTPDGTRLDDLTIEIDDRPGEANFYAVRVVEPTVRTSCTYTPDSVVCDTLPGTFLAAYAESPDLRVQELSNPYYLGLSDASFDGRSTRLQLYTQRLGQWNENVLPPYVEVFSLTEEAFRFLSSLRAYRSARNDPFSEPANVISNIEGGSGFFLVANSVKLPLPE